MRKSIWSIKGLMAVAMIAGLLNVAPAAMAASGDVIKTGTCSMASTWKLKLKADNTDIQAEFEVDSGVVGETWHVRLLDNGVKFFGGNRVTKAPSGSFTVSKLTPNLDGTDVIKGRATNLTTGEVCAGKASFTA